jgi:SH3-like domain-containing protein
VTSESGFTITAYRSGKRSTNNIYELRNDSTRVIAELRPNATGKKGNGLNWFVYSLTISHFKPSTSPVSVTTPKTTEVISKAKSAEEKPKASENKITQTELPGKKTIQPQAIEKTAPSAVSSLRTTIKLRSGPSISQPSIYDIKPNSPLTIMGKENGWYKVKIDGKEGFVYAGLINAGKSGGYISKTAKQNGLVKDDEKNVIGNARAGEHLVLLSGLRNNRYKVILSDGKTGYVTKDTIDGGPLNSPPPSVP